MLDRRSVHTTLGYHTRTHFVRLKLRAHYTRTLNSTTLGHSSSATLGHSSSATLGHSSSGSVSSSSCCFNCSDSSRTTVHTQKFKCHFSKTQSLPLLLKTIQTLEGSRISTLISTLHSVSQSIRSPLSTLHRSRLRRPDLNSKVQILLSLDRGSWKPI